MKRLYTLLFSFLVLSISAQVMDVQVKDCGNMPSSIHTVLATGKVLLVASEGLDCSICKNKAPGLQAWAAQNSSKIQVWGAMTYTYSNNVPSCAAVSNWVSSYGWNDVFAFIDTNKFWFQSGTPRFTVYDPADSTIAYQGFDENAAKSKALELSSGNTVGIKENTQSEFYVSQSPNSVALHNLPKGFIDIQLTSLTGKVVRNLKYNVDSDIAQLGTSDLNAGVYLVSVENKTGFKAVRKVYVK